MATENLSILSIEESSPEEILVPSTVNEHLKGYNGEQRRKMANSFEFDKDSREDLTKLTLFVAAAVECITNAMTQDELCEFDLRVSGLSATYRENMNLLENLKTWYKSRKNLIRILKSSAIQLDQNKKTANLGRFIGSLVDFCSSLELGLFESVRQNIVEYAGSISSMAGFVTGAALGLTPHLGYLGLMSCFGELLMSKSILSNVLRAIKEDMDMFQPLQEWYNETDVFDAKVKKLFPYGIDLNIVKSISKSLPNLDTHLKVFSAVFISNVRSNQDLFSNGNFVSKVFLFSRSAAAREWYNRIMQREHPLHIEGAKIYFKNELRELVRLSPDLSSTIDIGKFSLKMFPSVPSFLNATVNGMFLYSAYKDLNSDTRHNSSETLRDMAKNASAFLNIMQKVVRRLSGVYD